MKKIFLVLTFLLALCTNVFAAMPSLIDNANTLQPGEKQRVTQMLEAVERKHNIRCAVVTVKSTGSATPGQYANKILDAYYTDGSNGNILLLMDMAKRKWHVSYDRAKLGGMLNNEFAIGRIEEKMLPALKQNQFAEGYGQYASTVDELITYYEKKGEPMEESNLLISLVGAIFAGAMSATGYRAHLRSALCNVERATSAGGYLQDFEVTQSHDNYLYTTARVIPIASGGDSSDGGDSGHGGGGGSF